MLSFLMFVLLLSQVSNIRTKTVQWNLSASMMGLLRVLLAALTGILIAFYVHTLMANYQFIEYYQGGEGAKDLDLAYQNPYLGEQARWIDYSAAMYSAIELNDPETVQAYIDWGERLLADKPDVDLYIKLVDAYEFLGNKIRYCETAKEGDKLYPNSERFDRAVLFCEH